MYLNRFRKTLICLIILISIVFLYQKNINATESNAINACSYGMVGDSNFDNTQIFNELISSYDSIYIPSGIYYFSGTIEFKKNISIIGDNKDTTIFFISHNVLIPKINHCFLVTCQSFNMKNITFKLHNENPDTSSYQNYAHSLFKIGACYSCKIESCNFICEYSSPFYFTSFLINSDKGNISNVSVSKCCFENNSNKNVGGSVWIFGSMYNINNVSISDCTTTHTGKDENVAIWSNPEIVMSNILFCNNDIINHNLYQYSDNILTCNVKNQISNLILDNNKISGDGLILTNFKLLGESQINFTNNYISTQSTIHYNNSLHPYLLKFENANILFSGNTINCSLNNNAFLHFKKYKTCNNNNFNIVCKALSFEQEYSYVDYTPTLSQFEENNFNLDTSRIIVSMPILFTSCSLSCNNSTTIYLSKEYSSMLYNNCVVDPKFKYVNLASK